jgi:hypothetical protein
MDFISVYLLISRYLTPVGALTRIQPYQSTSELTKYDDLAAHTYLQ